MKQYISLLRDIMSSGKLRTTRSGDVYSDFERTITFDMREGFPAITTKKLAWNAMVGELLWFLNGETHLSTLRKRSCLADDKWTIWTNDAKRWHESGHGDDNPDSCGKLYGHMWRNWNGFDQVQDLIYKMKNTPSSRYMLVQAFNPSEAAEQNMALPPCHTGFQVYVSGNEFDLNWTQRSVDVGLGLPFNIASYALLMQILGKITGLTPRYLSGSLKDVHVYADHLPGLKEQALREPLTPPQAYLPAIRTLDDLQDLTAADFKLVNYVHHDNIKLQLSVG